jgi:hypothetical protein
MGTRMVLAALLVLGCAKTEVDRCRTAAYFQQDPALREAALSRCEIIALRESEERMHEEDRQERAAEKSHAAP